MSEHFSSPAQGNRNPDLDGHAPESDGACPAGTGRTVLRIARIACGQQIGLAVVRNISSDAVTLEVPGELQLDEPVEIEMGPGRMLNGLVRWRDGLSAGIRLLKPIDVDQVLEKQDTDEHGRTIRAPRIPVVHPAEIDFDSGRHAVEIRDISVRGARIAYQGPAASGARIQLRIPAHDPIPGVVRWAKNGDVGIGFDRPVRIDWLMTWLSSRPTGPARQEPGPNGRPRYPRAAIVIAGMLAASYLNAALHLLH